MSTEDKDVLKIELPPYVEEHSPFPDVETETSFEENKEEIYRRNIELAANNTSGAYRVMYPENADAEEIYPQGAPADKSPAVKNASAKAADGKNKLITAALCAAVVIIVAIAAFSLGRNEQALDINASALSHADDMAKQMHTAATAGIAELYVEGYDVNGRQFENSGTVFIFGDTERNMADVVGNSFSGYVYGVFEYDTYTAEYALWSAEPIPEEYKRKLTDSEQEALAKKGIIIGCYPADGS